MNPTTAQAYGKRAEFVASLMDNRFRIPGTPLRFGLDGILGLLPGVGDAAGLAMSLWLVAEAARLRAPRRLLARMLINVAVDAGVGTIPVVGDIFDFFWKANRKNADLLRRHVSRTDGSSTVS